MVEGTDGHQLHEIEEEFGKSETNGAMDKHRISMCSQSSQRGLLDEKKHMLPFTKRLLIFPSKAGFMKLNSSVLLSSPSIKFRQFAEEKDEVSRSVPNPVVHSPPIHFRVPFVKNIDWGSLMQLCKQWIKNPMNMALFIWIACVAISGAILFMVMTGMLNHALPKKSQRDTWFEVNNQILNALFTLMCLYQHPRRFHHLVLLCRWKPKDVQRLRKEYCKNGMYKPNEWMHLMVVVALLHLNCFAQYALCGLNLGYPRSRRPPIGVGLCISVSFGAAAAASVYNILSPLGRDYETQMDEEAQRQTTSADSSQRSRIKSLEKRYSFAIRDDNRAPESRPEWIGGLSDFWDNLTLAYLSLFCSCCVFGWNMERLGFGNMYVHIVTFLLFCMAPFFIFNLAAINIDNTYVREALGITGILLCAFGWLYGGFWRIQMRKRYNLPSNTCCCGNPEVTDCIQWLCCCSCSLAQEVRTADYYDIVEDKFFLKQTVGDVQSALSPLPREDGMPLFNSRPSSPYNNKSNANSPYRGSPSPNSPYRENSAPSSPYNGLSSPSYGRIWMSPSPSRSPVGARLPKVDEDLSMIGGSAKTRAPVFSVMDRED